MEPPPGTAAGQEEQELRERAFFLVGRVQSLLSTRGASSGWHSFFVKSSMHLARLPLGQRAPALHAHRRTWHSYVRLVRDVKAAQPARRVREPGSG